MHPIGAGPRGKGDDRSRSRRPVPQHGATIAAGSQPAAEWPPTPPAVPGTQAEGPPPGVGADLDATMAVDPNWGWEEVPQRGRWRERGERTGSQTPNTETRWRPRTQTARTIGEARGELAPRWADETPE